jgi:hypothetical protein
MLISCGYAQQAAPQSAHDLVRDVIYNELQDRERDSYWQYRGKRVTPSQNTVREEIETRQGPIFRVLERDGKPLNAKQQLDEDARLKQLLSSPRELARNRQNHDQDEQRLQRVMRILPNAFLFDYDGASDGDAVQIKFRPNPAFAPNGYEERIMRQLAGALVVNQTKKRLVSMNGQLAERVDFGYGLIGHIEKDSSFQLRREPVTSTHWKTSLVDVHVDGKILLFNAISRQQHEERSNFQQVPLDISPAQAKEILDRVALAQNGVSVVSSEVIH